jgi:hypothetical protein
MGNISSLVKSNNFSSNISKQGRWILKNNKQIEISEYWTNIDHCGDKLCGNLLKTKEYYDKEILKIKK